MSTMPYQRYEPVAHPFLDDRTWPNREVTKAPTWCSVDLRDGNQALIDPMDAPTKLRFFHELVKIGFTQIEVGFPAASETDYGFVRTLIEHQHIPDDVTMQVLTQARAELIRKTFEAVRGAKRVIVHLYNPTSWLQRRVVFGHTQQDTVRLAENAATRILALTQQYPETDWTLQYSPESFTGTERDFAVRICNAVIDVWRPTPQKKMIINLPATVELFTPNIYADMIEYMCRHLRDRECIIVSLHTHNDRGTGIAATELGLLAGADRVEGTLFGNGERTGNLDLVVTALNLMQQGIDPELDFSDLESVKRVAEECTGMRIHERHPYAGALAFTALSGGHQDAIRKGLKAQKHANRTQWDVPYLHIDPRDIGASYKGLIRVTSQSGKSGIGHVMEEEFHMELPRDLTIDFSAVVQTYADKTSKEVRPEELFTLFEREYYRATPLQLVDYSDTPIPGARQIEAMMSIHGKSIRILGQGNGPLNAFTNALSEYLGTDIAVDDLHQDSLARGSDAMAISYVPVHLPNHPVLWGVGMNTDTTKASLHAIVSAVNRSGIIR